MRNATRATEASRRSLLLFVFVPVLLGLGLVLYQTRHAAGAISAREAYEMAVKDSTVILLDVRTSAEFTGESGHLRGARLIPVEDLARRTGELDGVKNRLIIAYCRSGRRSRNAATLLGEKGFRVVNLEGGILAWNEEGLPVEMEGRR